MQSARSDTVAKPGFHWGFGGLTIKVDAMSQAELLNTVTKVIARAPDWLRVDLISKYARKRAEGEELLVT